MPLTNSIRLACRDRSSGLIQKDHYFSECRVPNVMTKASELGSYSYTGAQDLDYSRPQIKDIIHVSSVSDTRHVWGDGGSPALQPSGDYVSR